MIGLTSPRPRERHGRRPAFALVELLASIGLLAIFAAMAVQSIRLMGRVSVQATDATEAAARLDVIVAKLRADVWNSAAVTVDGATARVRAADGSEAVWAINPAGDVTRTPRPAATAEGGAGRAAPDAYTASEWRNVAPGLRFETDGRWLVVILPAVEGREDRLTLVSQLALAGGRQ